MIGHSEQFCEEYDDPAKEKVFAYDPDLRANTRKLLVTDGSHWIRECGQSSAMAGVVEMVTRWLLTWLVFTKDIDTFFILWTAKGIHMHI